MHIHVGGVPEHFNLPWHLGLEGGDFKQAGLDVSFSEYPTGTGALCNDLRAGKLEIVVALTEGLLMDIAQHEQIVLLAPYVLSPLRWGIHVAADSSYRQPQDLKGSSFAISREGSGSHLMALLWAREQGWQPDQVRLTLAGGLEALEQSVTQQQAGSFLWEVFTTLPRVKAGALRKIAEFPTPWPCFMLATRPELLATCKAEFERLLQVIYSLTSKAMQQSQKTIQLVAERYQLNPAEAQEWFQALRWATEATLPATELEYCRQSLKELGLI